MTVLVTGGAGYIGSHVCKAVAGRGLVPVAVDNLSTGLAALVRWGPLERGDIRNEAWLREVLCRHRPRAVLHFAALADVPAANRDPAACFDVNVGGTEALIRAMAACGVSRLVFSSSCAVYGIPSQVPIAEDAPLAPISLYGRSKLEAERVIAEIGGSLGVRSLSLRYFNAAGADPDGQAGECHDPESHLIPRVLMALDKEIASLDIMGADYPTPDGTCIRDYIHVSDLADAHMRALDWLDAGGGTDVFNLGCGHGLSVREIIAAAERLTGLQVPCRIVERRVGDPPVLVASSTAARDKLGITTARSGINTLLSTALDWHRIGRRQVRSG